MTLVTRPGAGSTIRSGRRLNSRSSGDSSHIWRSTRIRSPIPCTRIGSGWWRSSIGDRSYRSRQKLQAARNSDWTPGASDPPAKIAARRGCRTTLSNVWQERKGCKQRDLVLQPLSLAIFAPLRELTNKSDLPQVRRDTILPGAAAASICLSRRRPARCSVAEQDFHRTTSGSRVRTAPMRREAASPRRVTDRGVHRGVQQRQSAARQALTADKCQRRRAIHLSESILDSCSATPQCQEYCQNWCGEGSVNELARGHDGGDTCACGAVDLQDSRRRDGVPKMARQ